MSSSSNSSAKNRPAWANGRYDGGSAFGGTQPRLLPLGKKALVTPRASNSSSTAKQPKSKQVSLKAAFKRHQNAAPRPPTQQSTSKENRSPSQRALADGRSSSDDDNLPGAKEGRTAEHPGFFGRLYKAFAHSNDDDTSPSSAASSRQQSQSRPSKGIGKKILKPSASEKRRGPTIDFDASGEPAMDDSEMLGETQRRKRKRVQEGGRGQLDLVPAADFEGFGGRTQSTSSSSRKRVKRELEMGAEEKPVMIELEDDSGEEAVERTEEEDSWEPEPSTRPDSLPAPASSSHNPSKRYYAESSQSDDDTLQQQLVPRRDDLSVVLVPDSDDLVPDSEDEGMQGTVDECDRLAQSMGAGIADDSGYAEMEAVPEEETKDDHHPSLPMLPPSLASANNLRLSIGPASVDENVQVDDAPVPNSQSPFPSLSTDRTLCRTPSGILMPPPPLPPSRSSGSSSGEKVAVRNTPSPTEAIAVAVAEETPIDTPPASPTVFVPDTQSQLDYHPIPAPPLLFSPNRVLCEETQLHPLRAPPVLASNSSRASPIASTSKLSPLSPTTPKRQIAMTTAQSTSGWDSLSSAWAGQRPASPPEPASPRQSRLNEFFRIPSRPTLDPEDDDDDEETQLVEDSQPTIPAGIGSLTGSLTMEQMEAFRGAFNTTREMGRPARSGLKGDFEDVSEEPEEIEEAMEVERVESSDSEECWSPLSSPVKRRFPTLAGVGEGAEQGVAASLMFSGGSQGRGRQASGSQFRSGSQEQRKSQEQSSSAEQRGAEQLAQLETQWESYWSEETYQPFVPLRESL